MNKNQVSIATICWARDVEEEQLLRRSLTELARLEIPVHITDGGSGGSFIGFLKSFPHFHISEPCKGLWTQVKTSLEKAHASGSKFVFYTEPDKYDLFNQHLPTIIENIELNEQTGVHILTRSPKGFSSFPAFQQMTETTINNCCAEVTGMALDYTYGPFFLNKNIIPQLATLTDNIGWGWRPYAFIKAKQSDLYLTFTEKDFLCPTDQQQDDAKERLYRMKQLTQNIEAITLAAQ